jgi:hypothetical protein
MTSFTLLFASEALTMFGAVLLFGVGCICLGLMLMLAMLTMVSLRHRSRVGALPMDRQDGTATVGSFLCFLAFTGALLFFALAARVGVFVIN